MLGDTGMDVGPFDTQSISILEVSFNIFLRQLFGVHIFFIGAVDDFVMHISNIITAISKIATDHVEGHDRTGIAQMDVIISRGTTDVHFDFAFFHRNKFLFGIMQGVINFNWHTLSPL